MSFNDRYLQWRNRTRRFSRRSMLDAAHTLLRQATPETPEGLGKLPWMTALAVKWLCQDATLDHGVGPTITSRQFEELVNAIWTLPDDASSGDSPLLVLMRRILRPQIEFQRPFHIGHFREAALLSRLGHAHPLYRMYVDKTGLFPDETMMMFWSTMPIVHEPNWTFGGRWFSTVAPKVRDGVVERFLSLVSCADPELMAYMRSLRGARRKVTSEYFEFPALARYPLHRVGETYSCWHPTLLYRWMQGIVHTVLSEQGSAYIERFGRVFEAHVVAEAQTVGVECHDEQTLRSWLGHESQVTEALLAFDDCNILIEAKSGLFDETVMTVGDAQILAHKFRAIRGAMNQGWTVARRLPESASAPKNVRGATEWYLLIITNRDLLTGRATMLANAAPEGTFVPEDTRALERLPLAHIYIMSIDDFESLTSAARQRSIDIPAFLRSCVQADSSPSTSKFLFDQHLANAGLRMGFSDVVHAAFERSTHQVEAILSQA